MPSAAEPVRAFVDTNVLVYSVDRSEPEKRPRARALLADSEAQLVLSSQVLGEFFVVTTRRLEDPLNARRAATAVAAFSELPVVPIDADLVSAAVMLSITAQLSYWDALIVAAASSAGCSRLLSEDLNSGQIIAGVRVENPFAA